MKKITLLLALFISAITFAQTTLSAGDIVIIGLKGNSIDEYVFVLLKDIEAGTEINFTDNGWYAIAGNFRGGENTSTFTADQAYSAGKLFTVTGTTVDSRFSGGLNNLSTAGDQVLAYQGTSASPTFIYAVNAASTVFSATDEDDSNATGLPVGLTDGVNAVAVGAGAGFQDEFNNAYYNGITDGTAAEILAAVSNDANWVGTDDGATYSAGVDTADYTGGLTLSSGTFNISGLVVKGINGEVVTNKGEVVAVYNILGQKVTNENLISGIYVVYVKEGGITDVKKIIL